MFLHYRFNFKSFSSIVFILFIALIPFSKAANPVKIMPLGNSITQADKDHYSYRYNLWKKLIDANVSFDFVGSHNTNKGGNPAWPAYKGNNFDSDHEGHSGWTIDQILNGFVHEPNSGKLSEWLQGYTPDVVLLHAGTNDALMDHPLESTVKELEEVINQIRQKNPGVTILLAKLIPAHEEKVGKSHVENIKKLNERIVALAPQLNTSISNVVLVDQFEGFDATPGADTYDGLHPNASGEEKMAKKWFAALSSLMKPLAIGDELENKYNFQLYPTLVYNQPLNVKAERLSAGSPVEIFIYTTDGKLAMQLLTETNRNGDLVAEIEVLSKLQAGMYIIRTATPEVSFIRRFVINR
jgi:hypothetical protein